MSRKHAVCWSRPVLLAIGAASLLATANAQAQEAANAPRAESSDLETIVVTGSRIRRDPLEQNQPIVDLGTAEIARTGLTSIGDVLQRLPGSGGGLNSKFNNSGNFGFPPDGGGVGAGGAEIDLRYLGSRRTLVLVDGLRYVNGSSASGVPGSTDLNTIPEAMIERIEVLQEGASPIYGSDAIAGVVNIITKQHQEGMQATGYWGAYDEGDGETKSFSLTFGAKGERTSIVLGANYVDQGSISSADRKIAAFPDPFITQCNANCSSGTPRGRFIFAPNPSRPGSQVDVTLRPGLTGRPRWDPANPTGPNSDFVPMTVADRFNFQPYNYILTPSERLGFFGQVTHELTDTVNLRVKAVYNNRKSANQAAPLPLFVGPDGGNGNLLDTIEIDATNPYNPFGFDLTAENGFSFIGRRLVEAGPRIYKQEVNTYYVSATLDGEFKLGGRTFYWDVNGVYSENRADQVFYGNVNARKVAQALGPISQCTAPCVPLNLFGGPGSITAEQLGFISFIQKDLSEQKLADFTANLSGDLFDLPAGAVGIAVGYEHRDQRGFFLPDPVVTAGESSDVPAAPTSGRFNVDEVYGEIRVPILRDMAFARLLEASFAARHSNYSTFGGTTTLQGGLMYRPTDDLLVRGSYAEGFRAPSIGELFGSPSRYDAELVDPCTDYTGSIRGRPATPAVQAACAAMGVPASYTQLNSQISTTTGGNEDLEPETSKSYTYGIVYSPAWISNVPGFQRLSLEVNYYQIKLEDAIQPYQAQVILDRCVILRDDSFCNLIGRTSSGQINRLENRLTNIGGIKTKGIDFALNYASPQTGAGEFRVSWTGNLLIDYHEFIATADGTATIKREGTERGNPDQVFPRFKSNVTLQWLIGAFDMSFTGRYISGVTERCTSGAVQTLCSDPDPANSSNSTNRMKRRFYGDAQFTYTPEFWDQRASLTLGVNNLFDTAPPACFSCGLNNFDPGTYDVPGRFGYVRLSYKM